MSCPFAESSAMDNIRPATIFLYVQPVCMFSHFKLTNQCYIAFYRDHLCILAHELYYIHIHIRTRRFTFISAIPSTRRATVVGQEIHFLEYQFTPAIEYPHVVEPR